MQLETITVQYVNPPKPGKKMGSIKDVAGRYINVWPDKLAQFQPNQTYSVLLEQGEWQGKTTYTLKSMADDAPAARPHLVPAPQAVQTPRAMQAIPPRETSARDAERMFVCSLLNAAIQSGQVEIGSGELTSITNALRSAWQQTFGKDEPKF